MIGALSSRGAVRGAARTWGVVVLLLCLAMPASALTPQEADQQLAVLRHHGRAQPEAAAAALVTLLGRLPPQAPQRITALEQLGLLRAVMNDTDGGERVAAQLEQLAQELPAWRARAEAGAGLVRAKLAYHTGTVNRAERLMSEALHRLPDNTPPLQRVPYLLLAGDVKERTGRLDDSVRLHLQALQLADASGEPWLRSEVRSTLAYTLYEARQKDRARALNQEAVSLAEQAGDSVAMAGAMTTQAILLGGEGKDDPAELAALRSAIEHARRAGAKRDEILGLANIADYYLKRGQYEVALQMSEQALPLAREVKNRSSESLALTNIGLALISLHRKAEGLKAVQAALAIEERIGAVTSMADTYAELGTYLEKAGELKDALEAYRQHRRLADEVFRQEQQQAIVEMQESYDNERRNRDIDLLNRESRLKEEQLLERELHQRLWATGAALALLVLGVIVLLVQRGRRANQLLASTNELLKVQSERDPLTGLANRRHFQQALVALAADGRLAGTIYLLDLDHFKRINDEHGHAAGDAVLVETARRLRATLREEDLIVRWGGEEFLVVVQALSPEQVEGLAQRLLAAVAAEPMQCVNSRLDVTASVGFATFPLEPAGVALSWERAIELVDTAMYLAKAHGRNRAYGIRLLHAATESEVVPIVKTLEQSWREGRVALTLLQGPPSAQEVAA
ncbi:GGDEF domain-containing protein [Ideonella sp. BN130291]|uniref:GGDEF domain-containing protein n=1 Tax=Ideonella sp. BN130291 TaxID=3112940 RepID=UPI002E25F6F9|nr:GGDEF domain-containing protein [Ideonella sp. BN130291]